MFPDNENAPDKLDRHLADLPEGREEPVEFFKAESVVPPRAPEADKPAPYEPSTYEEKKERKYWPVALATTLFVLGGGGFYAMTGMQDTAKKLVGGTEYGMQSERGASEGGSVFSRAWDIFAEDEDAASSGAAKLTNSLNPKLLKAAALSQGGSSGATPAAGGLEPEMERDEAPAAAYAPAPRARAGSGKMMQKLQSTMKMNVAAGGGSSATQGSPGSGFGNSGTAIGVVSGQRESTEGGVPKGTNKQGVMDSLRAVFKTSLQGARIASQDSAKDWVAKTFHATSGDGTSLNYGEELRGKLDKVNPNSIPHFLRDIDGSSNGIKRLASSKVGRPRLDVDGTSAALANDEKYQRSKMMGDMAGAVSGAGKSLGKSDGGGGGGGGGSGGGGGGSGGGGGDANTQGANTASYEPSSFENPGVAPEDTTLWKDEVVKPEVTGEGAATGYTTSGLIGGAIGAVTGMGLGSVAGAIAGAQIGYQIGDSMKGSLGEVASWANTMKTEGYGDSCGGTPDSPACCLDMYKDGKYIGPPGGDVAPGMAYNDKTGTWEEQDPLDAMMEREGISIN